MAKEKLSLATALGMETGTTMVLDFNNQYPRIEFRNIPKTLGVMAEYSNVMNELSENADAPEQAFGTLREFLINTIKIGTAKVTKEQIAAHVDVMSMQSAIYLAGMLVKGESLTPEEMKGMEMDSLLTLQTGESTKAYLPTTTPMKIQQN